jgi:glycosyltransferase involved in cell wall biosynthesis
MPNNLTHYLPLPKKIIIAVNEYLWRDFAKVFNKIPFVAAPTEIAAEIIRPRLNVPVMSVTNGIDLLRFNPGNDRGRLRERYRIPKNFPVLLYVGRLDGDKRINEVIEASAKAMGAADFSLVIAGKGFDAVNLQKLARNLRIEDKVFFTGFVPDEDLPDLYAIGDCFVIACQYELQCLVVMEAMATGLPIIAAKAGALPHLVEEGRNGFLFPPGDTSALAQKIIDIMSDKEKRLAMGKESLRVIKNHDIGIMIEKYLHTYDLAIKRAREISLL